MDGTNRLQEKARLRSILAVLLIVATPAFAASWVDSYEKGVRLIAEGQAGAAKPALEEALAGPMCASKTGNARKTPSTSPNASPKSQRARRK